MRIPRQKRRLIRLPHRLARRSVYRVRHDEVYSLRRRSPRKGLGQVDDKLKVLLRGAGVVGVGGSVHHLVVGGGDAVVVHGDFVSAQLLPAPFHSGGVAELVCETVEEDGDFAVHAAAFFVEFDECLG